VPKGDPIPAEDDGTDTYKFLWLTQAIEMVCSSEKATVRADHRRMMTEDLRRIWNCALSGRRLLTAIVAKGFPLTIQCNFEIPGDDAHCDALDEKAAYVRFVNGQLVPGKGCGSTIHYNAITTTVKSNEPELWLKRPTAICLAHELCHAWHNAMGRNSYDLDYIQDGDKKYASGAPYLYRTEEVYTTGSGSWWGKPQSVFCENDIRSDWFIYNPGDVGNAAYGQTNNAGNGPRLAIRDSYTTAKDRLTPPD
jgi:hypothetical protein